MDGKRERGPRGRAIGARDAGQDARARPPVLDMKGARAFAWTAFLLLDSLYLVSCIQRTAIPGAVFNNLQGDFLMTASQITWASSVYTLVYGAAQLLTGGAADRFGGKRTGIAGGFLIAAGLLLLCFAKTPGQLYFSRALAAFGSSFMYVSIVKIAHVLFPPRQFGALLGLSCAVGFLGAVLGTLPIRLCISRTTGSAWLGWRTVFFVLGAACLLISLCSARLMSALRERPARPGLITWRTIRGLFDRRGRFCFITYSFWGYPVYFMMQAVIGQKFMQDCLGLSPDRAASFTLTLSLASIAFCLLGIPASRLCGKRRKPLMLASAYSQVAAVLMMLAAIRCRAPAPAFYAAFAVLAVSQVSTSAKGFLTLELLDTRTIALNEAVRNCFPFLGATFASYVCGVILDRFVLSSALDECGREIVTYRDEGYVWVLVFALALSCVNAAANHLIPETNGKRPYANGGAPGRPACARPGTPIRRVS